MSISMPLGCTKVIDTDLLRVILNNDRHGHWVVSLFKLPIYFHTHSTATPLVYYDESDTQMPLKCAT